MCLTAGQACRALDRIRIDFVSALGLDHRNQVLDHVDIRGLDIALADRAVPVDAGHRDRRRARGHRLAKEVLACRIKAGRIDEGGGRDLTERRRTGRRGRGHRAVRTDAERGRRGGHGDRRDQRIAVGGHKLTLRVDLEAAVPSVGGGAVRHLDLKEALAIDRQIHRIFGLGQIALTEEASRADRAHAGAELQADRCGGGLRFLRARLAHVLVKQILELRVGALVAVGADVGQVLRNGVELHLLRIETGCRNPE